MGVPSPQHCNRFEVIPSLPPIKHIFTGADCCYALTTQGELYSWGNSEYGQTGHGTASQQITAPVRLPINEHIGGSISVESVAVGGSFALVLSTEGQLYSVGYGCLGLGQLVETTTFQVIPALVGTRVVKIAAGNYHCLAVRSFSRIASFLSDCLLSQFFLIPLINVWSIC